MDKGHPLYNPPGTSRSSKMGSIREIACFDLEPICKSSRCARMNRPLNGALLVEHKIPVILRKPFPPCWFCIRLRHSGVAPSSAEAGERGYPSLPLQPPARLIRIFRQTQEEFNEAIRFTVDGVPDKEAISRQAAHRRYRPAVSCGRGANNRHRTKVRVQEVRW